MSQAHLTPEQAAALHRYAKAQGRLWKSRLGLAWETGRYMTGDSALLQQIRNDFGPAWLRRFKLPTLEGK